MCHKKGIRKIPTYSFHDDIESDIEMKETKDGKHIQLMSWTPASLPLVGNKVRGEKEVF